MLKFVFITNLFLLCSIFCASANSDIQPIRIDYANFWEGSQAKLDIYYMLENEKLIYEQISKDSIRTHLIFQATIKRFQDVTQKIEWDFILVQHKDLLGQPIQFFGLKSIYLNVNDKFELIVLDGASAKEIIFSSYQNTDIKKGQISDVLPAYFAGTIEEFRYIAPNMTLDSALIKGDLYILPNPSLEYYAQTSKYYSYFEYYPIDYNKDKYTTLNYKITDGAKRVVLEFQDYFRVNEDVVRLYPEFDIAELPSGVYFFEIWDENGDSKVKMGEKRFYIMNILNAAELSARFFESQSFEESQFATMDEKRVDYEFRRLKVILSKFEMEKYDLLSEHKARQRALFQFWNERDPDTTTRINERLQEFDKSTEYANKLFSFGGRVDNGWESERGKIVLKYGVPDERNVFMAQDERKAAEEWFYSNVMGGLFFYFVDVYQLNNHILAHTNAPGENFNDMWIIDYNPAIDPNRLRFMNQGNIEKQMRRSR